MSLQIHDPDTASTQRQPTSFTAQVEALGLGEVTCKIKMIDSSLTLERAAAGMTEAQQAARNAVTSSVRNAKNNTGNGYSISMMNSVTPSGEWFILAIVKRVE